MFLHQRPHRSFAKILAVSLLFSLSAAANQLTVSWDDNSTEETGFRIERSLDGVTFSPVRTVDANVTTHVDSGLASATTYWYRVCAYKGDLTSGYSNTTRGTTPGTVAAVNPPAPIASASSRLTRFSGSAVAAPWGAGAFKLSFGISSATKQILVRGIGPGLDAYTSSSTLNDPRLELLAGTALVGSNDNWGGTAVLSSAFTQLGAFPLSSTSKDAALLISVPAKSYSVSLLGKKAGKALAELFDADAPGTSTGRITKVFARAPVGTGDSVFVVGFTLSGDLPQRLLLRAIGPSLSGIQGVLRDPKLQIHQGSTVLKQNDNWAGASSLKTLFSAVGASSLASTTKDAAIDITLEPGSYTAVVSGVNSSSGIAQFELYLVP